LNGSLIFALDPAILLVSNNVELASSWFLGF